MSFSLIWKLHSMCVGAGLEQNSAGLRPSRNWVWCPWYREGNKVVLHKRGLLKTLHYNFLYVFTHSCHRAVVYTQYPIRRRETLSSLVGVVSATSSTHHPPFCPFSIIREWHAANMATAGSAHFELQKSSSETYGWLGHLRPFFFTIWYIHTCTRIFF